jgi:hypothetical protein
MCISLYINTFSPSSFLCFWRCIQYCTYKYEFCWLLNFTWSPQKRKTLPGLVYPEVAQRIGTVSVDHDFLIRQ